MAELFGAPNGIMAFQQNQLEGLQAQKLMGDLAAQPLDMAYRQAQTRLVTSEAADKETASLAQQQMLDLQKNFLRDRQAAQAREQLVETGKASGRDATVSDLAKLGKRSQADDLIQFADYAANAGAPPTVLAKMREQIAGIQEKEAIAGYRAEQAAEVQGKAQTERAARISSIANAAAQSPQGYLAVLSNPELRALLPTGQLTMNWGQDRLVLQTIAQAGQDSIKQQDLARKLTADRVQEQRTAAANAASMATADAAAARAELTRTHTANIIKNGGEASAAAAGAKRVSAEARQVATEARLRKEFPPSPLNSAARTYGKAYTSLDGSTRATWQWDPATEEGVWVPLSPTKALRNSQALITEVPGGAGRGATLDDEGE